MGLILGTGVGGGLIFNGKPPRGSYITGEFGHMRLPVDGTMMGLISQVTPLRLWSAWLH